MTTKYKYAIYQSPVNISYCFMSYDFAKRNNLDLNDYVRVFSDEIESSSSSIQGVLEDIYYILNTELGRRRGFAARSLSKSDIILIEGNFYYVDTLGFINLKRGE